MSIPLWIVLAVLGALLSWGLHIPVWVMALPVAIELVCWLIRFPHRLANRAPWCFQLSDFPGLEYELGPDTEFQFHYTGRTLGQSGLGQHFWGETFSVSFKTNSQGLRDYEYPQEKTVGTFRILGLGDSPTFGEGVSFEDIYLKRLEHLLNAAIPASRFEVINGGVSGFNTKQELALLRKTGLGYQPDLILLAYSLDDIVGWASPRIDRSGYLVGKDIPLGWKVIKSLSGYSHFFRFVAYLRIQRFLSGLETTLAHWYAEESNGWRESKRALREIQTVADEKSIELVVVILPALYRLDDQYPGTYAHQQVRRFCEENGTKVLDLLPSLQGLDYRDLWVHPTDIHPNSRAHQIIAREICRFLIAEDVVPG